MPASAGMTSWNGGAALRILSVIAVLCSALPSAASAEFRVGLGGWRYDLSGFVVDQGKTYDFERDLGLEASGRRSLSLELDTKAGWPDFAAGFTQLGAHGVHEETMAGGLIGPIPLPGTTRTVVSDSDFDDLDLTARVPLRWGAATVSLGLTVKRLRGQIVIDDSEEPAPRRQDYDETFPQLHAQLRWPITSFLALTGGAQGIAYEGSRATELRATAELRLLKRLLVEAGWQQKRYQISVDDYRLDAKLDGVLLRFGFLLN